ncbi:MAG: glycosyltransferase family 4 protein [Archaeoglobaceae archaeon]
MEVCFVYLDPHPSHKGFAEAVNAKFCHYHGKFKDLRIPRALKSFFGGLTLPKADIYLAEGGAPLLPIWIKKRSHKALNIEIVGDETFMVFEETSKELRKDYPWYVNKVHKITMKSIDGAIAVSKMAEESIRKYLDIPTSVVYPYIEPELYERLRNVNPNIESFNIISVGYARSSKGMDILLQAFKIVKKEVDSAELFIVGKGHPREWEKFEGVHVLGYVQDLATYFEKCSLFVQSSRADTFPVATLEALRAGLPVIVTEKVGTKEVVENLRKDFVRKVSAEDIAEGILNYFDLSISKKVELSKKARELSEPFNKEEMCKRFREEFWKIVDEISPEK